MNLIGIIVLLISVSINRILRNKLRNYADAQLRTNLSGAEVAHKMLSDHGIDHIKITCTGGKHLTDHYNPLTRTVNLSDLVYHGNNAAAAAIAAHECGHAVQHAQGYAFLRFRSAMVPLLSATTRIMPWFIILGIVLINTTLLPLTAGISLFALTTLFSFVTLPVEFDASKRALVWMDHQGIVTSQEYQMAKSALWWAAMTYVIAALGSLTELLRLISLVMDGKHRNRS